MMAVVGTLGYNFQVILPLLARFSFDGGAAAYTALAVAMAAGSVLGALAAGARGRVGPGLLVAAAFGFGAAALIAAGAPTLPLEVDRARPARRRQRHLRRGHQLLAPARRGARRCAAA